MLSGLKDLFSIFGRAGQRRWIMLATAMVLVAFIEAASVAVVLPFLQLVLNPENAESAIASTIASALGIGDQVPLVLVMGWLAVFLFLSATCLSALTTWFTFRIQEIEHRRLATRLLQGYVKRPYSFFLERNTSALSKNVLVEAEFVAGKVLVPLANLAGRAVMVVTIFGFLIFADPTVALGVVVVVVLLYGGLYAFIRGRVTDMSARRVTANTERFGTAQEALGGIKEIKILGREEYFTKAFDVAVSGFSKVFREGQIIGTIPKYFLEALGIGGLLVLLLIFLQQGQAGAGIVPLLALYAAAAYRVMPALLQIYTGVTNLRFNQGIISLLRDELEIVESGPVPSVPDAHQEVVGFTSTLELRDVSFRYDGSGTPTLDGISMVITKNSCVGFVGETGSGKTTVIDILMGLFQPQSGVLSLDGEPLRPEQVRSWQNNIGYVPQFIYLSDSSIRSNIALGIEEESIDDVAVVRAAKMAGVHRFIVEETSLGYQTIVGERGVRLSGGERQRIGIARALYRDPDVLVLDEATSSLDNLTEKAVMSAIRALSGTKTIVIVAHRLTTIQDCDHLFVIDKGRVCEQGTYNQLLQKDGAFAVLAHSVPRESPTALVDE